jgi:hypothetical protein
MFSSIFLFYGDLLSTSHIWNRVAEYGYMIDWAYEWLVRNRSV